ncbi:4-(cytidine 5'-diphospho)-2-C-methyl-D-erythritol kinase [Alphaproteobacteria bacterium GH1-50]|uniref:4-diphosphocytidyl-2-C-methyl-D-erythritol kinase n=1 Tax=Kangsaoukella pontilimi TaxID=2691042 RepID=A0A7C9J5C7_9RHOB|nr:4-(cytidine 5'-diphospho)-2-C-methyl-D-erythritol kinase [Kangsaoukella pontilimi]MXQ09281.1 4-(cytidine 5'-diphospho)-2-C-methyl-D-erythritol kinase [Kangsaoukella pontilimi]
MVEVFAPAKVNLSLHVTGQRPDGYHLLDSYVCFADIGDRVTVAKADETSLSVTGPFAKAIPTGADNLVLRAAELLGVSAHITLEKNLPAAAGIGGGSSDAAATLMALTDLYNIPVPDRDAVLTLGADVPVCLMRGQVRMRGIGDDLAYITESRMGWPMVLVNPGVSVSTPEVFRRLARKTNEPMPDDILEDTYNEFPDWLGHQRNDLEAPAIELEPVILDVLDALRAETGCRIARMSGSGATCFALFDEDDQASDAVAAIRDAHPDWWAVVAIS